MSYLMSGAASELERLSVQARFWEPAGKSLLAQLAPPPTARAADIGCGALGWMRLLSDWVGPAGEVIGTDIDPGLLEATRLEAAGFGRQNVELVVDDLFASRLAPASFDLVHARFMLASLGRFEEQLTAYLRLLRPGRWLVVEEPDSCTWRYDPVAPAAGRLIRLIRQAYAAAGGDFDVGERLVSLVSSSAIATVLAVETCVQALPPGHPYARLPLLLADSLEPRLRDLIPADELGDLLRAAAEELASSRRWGLTFTLVQVVLEKSPSASFKGGFVS